MIDLHIFASKCKPSEHTTASSDHSEVLPQSSARHNVQHSVSSQKLLASGCPSLAALLSTFFFLLSPTSAFPSLYPSVSLYSLPHYHGTSLRLRAPTTCLPLPPAWTHTASVTSSHCVRLYSEPHCKGASLRVGGTQRSSPVGKDSTDDRRDRVGAARDLVAAGFSAGVASIGPCGGGTYGRRRERYYGRHYPARYGSYYKYYHRYYGAYPRHYYYYPRYYYPHHYDFDDDDDDDDIEIEDDTLYPHNYHKDIHGHTIHTNTFHHKYYPNIYDKHIPDHTIYPNTYDKHIPDISYHKHHQHNFDTDISDHKIYPNTFDTHIPDTLNHDKYPNDFDKAIPDHTTYPDNFHIHGDIGNKFPDIHQSPHINKHYPHDFDKDINDQTLYANAFHKGTTHDFPDGKLNPDNFEDIHDEKLFPSTLHKETTHDFPDGKLNPENFEDIHDEKPLSNTLLKGTQDFPNEKLDPDNFPKSDQGFNEETIHPNNLDKHIDVENDDEFPGKVITDHDEDLNETIPQSEHKETSKEIDFDVSTKNSIDNDVDEE